jgi:hypothetical protein
MTPCDRTDDAVHHQSVRLLEILHDLFRLRSEDPVKVVWSQDLRPDEDPLQSLHIGPGVAQFDGRRYVTLPSSYVRALPGAEVVNMTPLSGFFQYPRATRLIGVEQT